MANLLSKKCKLKCVNFVIFSKKIGDAVTTVGILATCDALFPNPSPN
jgi:hypothetical protein